MVAIMLLKLRYACLHDKWRRLISEACKYCTSAGGRCCIILHSEGEKKGQL